MFYGPANEGALLCASVFHGDDKRQCDLSFRQIITHVLAQVAGVSAVVQHVVDQLECQTEVQTIIAQGLFLGCVRIGKHGCRMGRALKQCCCLAADNLDILLFADIGVVHVRELLNFSFGDGVGRVRQNLHHAHIAYLNHHLEGTGVQEISHQDAGGVAPGRVYRLAAPA